LRPFVVGHVAECGRHPEADKLSLCKVDDGSGELLQVVCGAPNVAQGQNIVFARVGTRMPDGSKIKKGKLRGQASLGMICSERELGLSDEHSGIMVLDAAAQPGTPVVDVLGCSDTLIEIDNKSVTHRPDLWGHYGFARELAAIYGRPLRGLMDGIELELPREGETVPITITAKERCARYCGLVLRDVKVGPSPEWLRYLLIAVGQRPINNVVDLTNFVLFDLGQPMHAFDLDRLGGPAIDVRMAREGERMVTLDGQERILSQEDLLICDAEHPVALAGVMGGEGTMVGDETQHVFLESASFHAAGVRRTSNRVGLRSESSARFEKTIDPAWAGQGAKLFAGLLQQLSPSTRVAGPITDPSGWSFAPVHVPLRLDRARRTLGFAIEEETVRSYLEPLGFRLEKNGEDKGLPRYDVDVPSWRASKDVGIEADLIEELGRRHGYDNIEPQAPLLPVRSVQKQPELYVTQKIKRVLAHECGMFEAYNYSFLSDELCERFGLDGLDYVRVTNSIATHLSRVRRDVLPSVLGSLEISLRHRERAGLFESGKGYRPETRGEVREFDGVQKSLPQEVHQCGIVLGDRREGSEHPLRELRGAMEHLLVRLGHEDLPARRLENAPPWLHPGRCGEFYGDCGGEERGVAYFGELHPELLDRMDVPRAKKSGGIAVGVVDIRALLGRDECALAYRPVPKFPEQPVDLAFLVDEALEVAQLDALLHQANPKLVRDTALFEIYRGPGLPEGKKSCNFTVRLGSDKKTLSAKDEEKYIARVRQLAGELGAELRG
jgi:phenylalanyl-tRNA synthetase beta chain